MKALVISGGGSKGAFAGGIAQYLIQEKKKDYQLFVGTSTGSLMLTHLALGKVEELKVDRILVPFPLERVRDGINNYQNQYHLYLQNYFHHQKHQNQYLLNLRQ